jgi:hypothetical protein
VHGPKRLAFQSFSACLNAIIPVSDRFRWFSAENL